ncbi:hypothetical protein [Nocardiopsis metallicus]|uniref:Uncharacterized protein n=1 Tax=Nocardiopsis metallicus TaxID=179819 RepID=A0A840WFM5_9ACTN|nr:hypothetical protein [Nocardiopsis metallicus]MBB5494904.1 hypothetical protein [Nocardiopsis metallicus]
MQNPIPRPRRSDDFRPLPPRPRRQPLEGPACRVCDHPSCRQRRAQNLPRLGGHRSEYAREHLQAAQLQAHYRHLVVYYGEATQSFWAATPTGMIEAPDIDTLLLEVWTYTTPPAPSVTRPRVRNTGRALAAV